MTGALNAPVRVYNQVFTLPSPPCLLAKPLFLFSFSTLNPLIRTSAYLMTPHDSQYIFMGTITKPHGIRGEMSLHTEAEKPKTLLGEALLAPPSDNSLDCKNAKPVIIASVRMHHQMALVTIEGIKDRTDAEQYRRYRIFIDRKKLPKLNKDEFYQTDLLDLDVFVENLDDDSYLGQLSFIDAPAGQELWTITCDDGQEILLPAVPEFVRIIDLDEEYIIVTPPPGLIDLYLQADAPEEETVETSASPSSLNDASQNDPSQASPQTSPSKTSSAQNSSTQTTLAPSAHPSPVISSKDE